MGISGRHLQSVQGSDKTHEPIASVAALSERLAGRQYFQHKFNGEIPPRFVIPRSEATWKSRSTRPDRRQASGEYDIVTRRGVEDAAPYKTCAFDDSTRKFATAKGAH